MAGRFLALAQRDGRWWFITSEGQRFFALGLNHIDPSPRRYASNGDLWQPKYGKSMERWLKESCLRLPTDYTANCHRGPGNLKTVDMRVPLENTGDCGVLTDFLEG